MTVLEYTDQFFAQGLQQSLYELMKDKFLCDIKLRADGQEICAHKTVLSAASPYFRTMFNSETCFKESSQDTITLYDMEFDILNLIVQFIYTSYIQINEDNVYSLMETADLFQINPLRACINHYLISNLSADNCLSLYVASSLRNYHDLSIRAFRYTLTHFKKVIETEEFLEVPVDVLLEILSSRLLNVADEGALLQSVLKWIKADLTTRTDYLEVLLHKIELTQVPMQILILVKNDSLFNQSHLQLKITSVINEILAKKYESGVEDFMSVWGGGSFSKHDKNMRYDSEQEVIFAIGGESSGMSSRSVECFTLGYDSWKCVVPQYIVPGRVVNDTRVIPTMRCSRYNAAVAYDHYNVYVMGGRNSVEFLDECETFNVKTNQWKNLPSLPKRMEAASATLNEGRLVIVGGRDDAGPLNCALEYDNKNKVWKELEPMKKARYFHGTASAFGFVFCVGGFISCEYEAAVSSAERYDPLHNKWSNIPPMNEPRAKFGCTVIDNYLYVMGGTDGTRGLVSVERYNVLTNQWSYMSPMLVPRSSFSVTVSDRRIYCLGGNDTVHYLNTVDKFNPATNKWHCVHSMQVSRFGSVAATLFVPLLREANP